jgi:transposase-like protein
LQDTIDSLQCELRIKTDALKLKTTQFEHYIRDQKIAMDALHLKLADSKKELENLKIVYKDSQTKCQLYAGEVEQLRRLWDAHRMVDNINLDLQPTETEWRDKLETIKNTAQTKGELVPFLDSIYQYYF